MNVFFFLGHTFFEETLAIAQEIKSCQPDSQFSGIVAARSDLIEDIKTQTAVRFASYDWLSGLERQWLDTPLDHQKLKKFEDKLGTDVMRRIIISDRELGVGLVSGGTVERTELIKRTQYDDDARWSYVVGLLDYLFTAFEKQKIDATFVYCTAGAVAFAIAEVSKYMGIAFTQPTFSRIESYQAIDECTYTTLNTIKPVFALAMKDPSLVQEQLPIAEKYIQQFRNNPGTPKDTETWTNIIMQNNTATGLIKTICIDLARWGAITLGLKGTKGVLRQRSGYDILRNNLKIFQNIRKIVKGKDKNFISSYDSTAPYAYFPLHVDPEASTMVSAPYHTDQIAVIEMLAKSLPAGMRLIVKEHKPMVGRRPKGYYKRINTIPDVHLASPFMDNFTLLKNAALACTITGTVGLESIILGKPLLVIGNAHYTNIGEGFVHCPEYTRFTTAIREALKTKPASDKAISTYIACIIKEGFSFSVSDMWFNLKAEETERNEATTKIAHNIIARVNAQRGSGTTKIKKVS